MPILGNKESNFFFAWRKNFHMFTKKNSKNINGNGNKSSYDNNQMQRACIYKVKLPRQKNVFFVFQSKMSDDYVIRSSKTLISKTKKISSKTQHRQRTDRDCT